MKLLLIDGNSDFSTVEFEESEQDPRALLDYMIENDLKKMEISIQDTAYEDDCIIELKLVELPVRAGDAQEFLDWLLDYGFIDYDDWKCSSFYIFED